MVARLPVEQMPDGPVCPACEERKPRVAEVLSIFRRGADHPDFS